VSKDENLTKSHVKYLESRIVQTAIFTKRYKIENANTPQASSLPPADRDAMEEFLTYIKLLIGILGHKLLEDVIATKSLPSQTIVVAAKTGNETVLNTDSNIELFFNSKGLSAKGILTDEGIVVLEKSEASLTQSDQIQIGYGELRESLINDGTITVINNKYVFQKNQLFYSPSAAACVIAGTSRNGRTDWKDQNGLSLNEIEKRKLS